MRITSPQQLLDQLAGATIASADVKDEEGLSLYLQDGRVFLVVGEFAVSILGRLDRLH